MTKSYVNHFETDDGIVVIFDGGVVKQINSTSRFWPSVKEKLESKDFGSLFGVMDLASRIKEYSGGLFQADPDSGRVFIDDDELPDALGNILIQLAEQDLPVAPLIHFWRNLQRNPSELSRQNLYGFLAANQVPITKDGCFLAYKRVNDKYKDCHTGKLDNSVGAVVSMPRDKVDPDPNVTCSRGLHVAAHEYAKDFYSNGFLMEVKVNPEHVVAVPTDYNQQKMRVCQYEVMRECAGKRDEVLYTGVDDDDWVDDDESVEFVDEEALTAVVSKDARGRVAIPKHLVEKIGLYPDCRAVALVQPGSAGRVEIYPGDDTSDENSTVYTVDKSCNIRVTQSMLAKAGLDTFAQFTLTVEGEGISIT